MCNRYETPQQQEIEAAWHISRMNHAVAWDALVFPRGHAPFLRAEGGVLACVTGAFGLIPWFANSLPLKFSTHNARSEDLASKATWRTPWQRGQRCLIPARSFDEPCWETGHAVWWRFRPADSALWALAGLWNAWTDPASGAVHESYTLLTVNADRHALMRRMHKPKPERPPDAQDKRSVIPLRPADQERWLYGTPRDAASALALLPPECFRAGPVTG